MADDNVVGMDGEPYHEEPAAYVAVWLDKRDVMHCECQGDLMKATHIVRLLVQHMDAGMVPAPEPAGDTRS